MAVQQRMQSQVLIPKRRVVLRALSRRILNPAALKARERRQIRERRTALLRLRRTLRTPARSLLVERILLQALKTPRGKGLPDLRKTTMLKELAENPPRISRKAPSPNRPEREVAPSPRVAALAHRSPLARIRKQRRTVPVESHHLPQNNPGILERRATLKAISNPDTLPGAQRMVQAPMIRPKPPAERIPPIPRNKARNPPRQVARTVLLRRRVSSHRRQKVQPRVLQERRRILVERAQLRAKARNPPPVVSHPLQRNKEGNRNQQRRKPRRVRRLHPRSSQQRRTISHRKLQGRRHRLKIRRPHIRHQLLRSQKQKLPKQKLPKQKLQPQPRLKQVRRRQERGRSH